MYTAIAVVVVIFFVAVVKPIALNFASDEFEVKCSKQTWKSYWQSTNTNSKALLRANCECEFWICFGLKIRNLDFCLLNACFFFALFLYLFIFLFVCALALCMPFCIVFFIFFFFSFLLSQKWKRLLWKRWRPSQ